MPLLLDTCATLWIANGEPISQTATDAIREALDADEVIFVSPITAWEIGHLSERGDISLQMSPEKWFKRLLEAPGLALAAMDHDVLIASSALPGTSPDEIADRIIVTTARENGYRLVTRDRSLLSYAEQGYLRALEC